MNKTELLTKLSADADERLVLARVMDKLELARSRSIPTHTFFLTLAQQDAAARLIAACGHPAHLFWGGWAEAERRLCVFLPDWMEPEDFIGGEETPITALTLTPSGGEKLTHRDYLGSILGLGLTREKIGDILLTGQGAQVVVLRETAPILLSQWTQAGKYPVKLAPLPLDQLTPTPGERKQIRATVASPRLDAVVSAGFSIPRSRAADLIRAGRVAVNHRPCDKADKVVAAGDVLTCRGLGKCVLTELGGTSKRGRLILALERYL